MLVDLDPARQDLLRAERQWQASVLAAPPDLLVSRAFGGLGVTLPTSQSMHAASSASFVIKSRSLDAFRMWWAEYHDTDDIALQWAA